MTMNGNKKREVGERLISEFNDISLIPKCTLLELNYAYYQDCCFLVFVVT